MTRGIGEAISKYRIPIGFGVLTTNNVEQAMERSGSKDANKGYEAALTAVEMINVIRRLSRVSPALGIVSPSLLRSSLIKALF